MPPNDSSMLQVQVSQFQGEIEEYKKKVEQRDEEVKLYKTKYENTSKQVAELVSEMCIILCHLA